MAQLFADAARAYLSAGINDTDTTIAIASGGALFPVATGTDWFKAVLQDASGIEIVYVTAHTSASTSFTVTRGQEGTTARSFAAGSVFGLRVTAADTAAFAAKLGDAPSDGKTYGRKDAAWAEVVAGGVLEPGDVLFTARTLTTPDYLAPDTVYLQSSYADAYAELGLIDKREFVAVSGPNTSDFLQDICRITDTVAVAVGNSGVIWRTTDTGATWTKLTGLPNTSDTLIRCGAISATVVIAVGNSGILWRSADAGATWSKITGPNTTDALRGFGRVSDTLAVVTGNNGSIWRTTDAGATWSKLTGLPNATDFLMACAPWTSNTLIAVGSSGAAWYSAGSASTWTAVASTAKPPEVNINFSDATTMGTAAMVAVGNSGIWRSTLNSAWSKVGVEIPPSVNLIRVVTLSATDAAALSATGDVYVTRDTGLTWALSETSSSAANNGFAFMTADVQIAVGAAGGVKRRVSAYDTGTQFATPKITTPGEGINAYIKS